MTIIITCTWNVFIKSKTGDSKIPQKTWDSVGYTHDCDTLGTASNWWHGGRGLGQTVLFSHKLKPQETFSV